MQARTTLGQHSLLHAEEADRRRHYKYAIAGDVNRQKNYHQLVMLLLLSFQCFLELLRRDLVLLIDAVVHLHQLVLHKIDVCVCLIESFDKEKQVEEE